MTGRSWLAAMAASALVLTARQVAFRFNVDRGWVYAHADELGVIRLGDGPRRDCASIRPGWRSVWLRSRGAEHLGGA